jgi:hypothetical protein
MEAPKVNGLFLNMSKNKCGKVHCSKVDCSPEIHILLLLDNNVFTVISLILEMKKLVLLNYTYRCILCEK